MSLYIQEDLLLKVLVFVFVFVFVCVFVIVLVISRWTLALSPFRRCIICWIWCSNHENIDILMLIGLVAEEEGGGGGEEKEESHSKVGTLWVRQSSYCAGPTSERWRFPACVWPECCRTAAYESLQQSVPAQQLSFAWRSLEKHWQYTFQSILNSWWNKWPFYIPEAPISSSFEEADLAGYPAQNHVNKNVCKVVKWQAETH